MKVYKHSILIIAAITVLVLIVSFNYLKPESRFYSVEKKPIKVVEKLPDFSVYQDVSEKKAQFFSLLYPILEEENLHLLKLRAEINNLSAQGINSDDERAWFTEVSEFYHIDPDLTEEQKFSELLERVDIIPPSLILTQAAIESGWGTSRFSRKANNLFGHWCFKKGCGLVPQGRDEGKKHEVAKFKTVNHSVRAYLKNLNTHHSYSELRKKRADLRDSKQPLTGIALAPTLSKYSEERGKYVKKISSFIKQNNLQEYNKKFYAISDQV